MQSLPKKKTSEGALLMAALKNPREHSDATRWFGIALGCIAGIVVIQVVRYLT